MLYKDVLRSEDHEVDDKAGVRHSCAGMMAVVLSTSVVAPSGGSAWPRAQNERRPSQPRRRWRRGDLRRPHSAQHRRGCERAESIVSMPDVKAGLDVVESSTRNDGQTVSSSSSPRSTSGAFERVEFQPAERLEVEADSRRSLSCWCRRADRRGGVLSHVPSQQCPLGRRPPHKREPISTRSV